jgi:CMP-N-acetylneuraminic acid synthetase
MITAFLPCRKGSERIPNKNIKPFAGLEGGLLKIKVEQLLNCKKIDVILVSSNDERVLSFVSSFDDTRIKVDERPEYLGTSETSTDELISYVPTIIKEGSVLWTHVTSPFVNSSKYNEFITSYFKVIEEGFDSLMTVKPIRSFVWDDKGALNYDPEMEKWPRTQTIKPLFEVDSGAFINSVQNYKKFGDRVGTNPFLYSQTGHGSFDIDWPEDFLLAESIWMQNRS